MRKFMVGITVLMFLSSCAVTPMRQEAESVVPELSREFRAAWVATVANIDWPSKPGLSTKEQKDELVDIMDEAVDLNLNAIVLQVRPQCDALYESKLEPWSYYLTGEMGKAPDPYWDPLEFAVKEAHKRCLELHAWFNPYRANHPSNKSGIPDNHISKTKPSIVKEYGPYLWMDPGEKATQDHSLSVILDVVKRYDIDGVHLDDYFYPYKVKDKDGKIVDFPDEPSWRDYKEAGGKLNRSDWRRQSVNQFINRMYRSVKMEKPWVKVGISPFGIWKPGHPKGVVGFNQYEGLYADAKLWLEKGWVDYFTPQLYWAIDSKGQPYEPLLKWWVEQNPMGRHIWPGNFTSRVPKTWKAEEILNQIKVTREVEGATGNVHFSMICLMNNRDQIADKLKSTVYKKRALIPSSPWLAKGELKEIPYLETDLSGREVVLKWGLSDKIPVRFWILSKREKGIWSFKLISDMEPRAATLKNLDVDNLEMITLSAIDRYGRETPPAIIDLRLP